MSTLPVDARGAIKKVWDLRLSEEAAEEQLAEITQKFSISVEEVDRYLMRLLLARNKASIVTVFYNENRWQEGGSCFDIRFGSQMLPRGSVSIGTLFANGAGAVLPPYLRTEQKSQLQTTLRDALDVLSLLDATMVEGPLCHGFPTLVIEM